MAKLNINNRIIFCRDNLDILEGLKAISSSYCILTPLLNKVFTAPMGSPSSLKGLDLITISEKKILLKEEWIQTIEEDNHPLYFLLFSFKAIISISLAIIIKFIKSFFIFFVMR